ncbi:hypothetical protein HOR18_gp003 [Staphylococcus phage vB_SscM-1]|uniref:Uncharacterized protein n=3 Tax=Viruses TaxID=10239 RepID=A0A1X9I9I6_9CAUD|nr:hypothetical protein HOR18_gp003 [Staphylococcus phage vB_SscM-1]ANT44666.1 hypothetical protein vB_SscM-1_003 [Staphylococcus phage vB_SscM-1]ANT44869.1 hypothetical protein vB_SscM-2_003 [Staphylococcus phage vB_SscM-2]
MNKNELSTMELHEMLVEANENTNGAYEHVLKYEEAVFWSDLEMRELSPQEAINMALYGSYKTHHTYIGLDGYGNLAGMTEAEYRKELLDLYEEYSQEL